MVDFNSPELRFEHQLREYVESIRDKIRDVMTAYGNTHPSLDIKYDTEGSGKWTISTYYKEHAQARGAMLGATFDAWRTLFIQQNYNTALPALLPAPTTPIEDEEGSGLPPPPI